MAQYQNSKKENECVMLDSVEVRFYRGLAHLFAIKFSKILKINCKKNNFEKERILLINIAGYNSIYLLILSSDLYCKSSTLAAYFSDIG